MIYKLPIHGEWREFDDAWLSAQSRGTQEYMRGCIRQWRENKLSMFLPHGVPWHKGVKSYAGGKIKLSASKYLREWKNDGVAFQNDWHNQYLLMLAPRRTGKTTDGAIKSLLFGCECNPEWEIFKHNGVDYSLIPKWNGPKHILVSSFAWENVTNVWNVYREFLPRYELGRYAPDWGANKGEIGIPRNLSFTNYRTQTLELEHSKTVLHFKCYTQPQHTWENSEYHLWHADEQPMMRNLTAIADGMRTMGDYTPTLFTLSGFVIDARPSDTGAAGVVKRLFWDGRIEKGGRTVRIGRYNKDIPSTPNALISQEKKQEAFDMYANPRIERDEKLTWRGHAVYFPGWEPGGGLCFTPDVWDRQFHIIPRLWDDEKTPKWITKYRSMDYADKGNTSVIWAAFGPLWRIATETGRMLNKGCDRNRIVGIVYRTLYDNRLNIATAAKMIIDKSHNRRVKVDEEEDTEAGTTYTIWSEVMDGETIHETYLDRRIGKQGREGGRNVRDVFEQHGIDVSDACANHNSNQIPALKDLLRIDMTKVHPFNLTEDGEPLMGSPSLFWFAGVGAEVIDEIESVGEDPVNVFDQKATHDGIDSLKYLASAAPTYMGDATDDENNGARGNLPPKTPFTGW